MKLKILMSTFFYLQIFVSWLILNMHILSKFKLKDKNFLSIFLSWHNFWFFEKNYIDKDKRSVLVNSEYAYHKDLSPSKNPEW